MTQPGHYQALLSFLSNRPSCLLETSYSSYSCTFRLRFLNMVTYSSTADVTVVLQGNEEACWDGAYLCKIPAAVFATNMHVLSGHSRTQELGTD